MAVDIWMDRERILLAAEFCLRLWIVSVINFIARDIRFYSSDLSLYIFRFLVQAFFFFCQSLTRWPHGRR